MRRMLVVLAAIVLIASGCMWTQPGYDAGNSHFNPTETAIGVNNVASLHQRWSTTIGGRVRELIQSNTGLVHATDGATVVGLDPGSGTQRWSVAAPQGGAVGSLLADGNDLLDVSASATGSVLERRSSSSGAVSATPATWTVPNSASTEPIREVVRHGPWVVTTWDDGTLVSTNPPIPEGDSGFHVTNLDDPSRSWSYVYNGSVGADFLYIDFRSPVIVGDRLYLVATQYELPPLGELPPTIQTLASWDLAACTDQCAPTDDQNTSASAYPATQMASPDGATLYTTQNSQLRALDATTGAQRWISDNFDQTLLAATNGFVVTSTTGSQIQVRPSTCASSCPATWTTTAVPAAPAGGAIANGVLYVRSGSSLLAYPLDCTDGCAPLWSSDLGSQVSVGPIVSNGQVLAGTTDGRVVAFGTA